MEYFKTFTAAALGGGLFVFAQFLITRHDEKKGILAEVWAAIKEIRKAIEEEKITSRRRYIFQFNIELRKGLRHTKEEWDQVHDDITDYMEYCEANKDYKNSRCDAAVEGIEEVYRRVWKENDFD